MLIAPAAGFRFRETGDLASVGTVLACWSASSNAVGSGNAGDLWCHAGDVKPLDVSRRAYGFSVRCVQNLRLLFIFHAKPEDKACKERYVANNLLPTSVIARAQRRGNLNKCCDVPFSALSFRGARPSVILHSVKNLFSPKPLRATRSSIFLFLYFLVQESTKELLHGENGGIRLRSFAERARKTTLFRTPAPGARSLDE